MDANDLRALLTVVMFLLFVGIVFWTYSGRNRDRFAEAARLSLDDDHPARPSAAYEESRK